MCTCYTIQPGINDDAIISKRGQYVDTFAAEIIMGFYVLIKRR